MCVVLTGWPCGFGWMSGLPSHVRLTHTVAERFEWGVSIELVGNAYAVRNP
jgi:hypothetical protein